MPPSHPAESNNALQDYQTSLFLLEQRNKIRVLEARIHKREEYGEDTTRDQGELAQKRLQLELAVENAGFYWDSSSYVRRS
jgi:hypothetical protein